MAKEKTTKEQAEIIGNAFQSVITKKFGSLIAPPPIFFSTGVKHLDALLGGGLVSSGLIMVSSTPETGKSTFAYQMSNQMIETKENSIVVYLDCEGAGSSTESNSSMVSRIDAFGLGDSPRFSYHPIVLNVVQLFEVVQELVDTKKAVELKTGKEFLLFIIWDSIPASPSSKSDVAEDANKIIGLKGRQLSFLLDKYLPQLKFNKVFFMAIDQVRADIQIDGPFAPKESTVGSFKNMKSASNIFSLQHNAVQWLFLSKTKTITRDSPYGLDGWELNILTEKNKIAPSKNYVTCVFDKFSGINVFWSEFLFLSEMTYSEKKILKTDNKLPYPLLITTTGKKATLKVVDKNKKVLYTSTPFFKKNAKNLYETDAEFKQWFDYAVDLSCYERITNGMFKIDKNQIAAAQEPEQEIPELNEIDITLDNQLNENPDQEVYQQSVGRQDSLAMPQDPGEPPHFTEAEVQEKIYKDSLPDPNTEVQPIPEMMAASTTSPEEYESVFDQG